MTGRVKSSKAGLWAVTRLLEPTRSSGKVFGVVTGLVGQKTDSCFEIGQTYGSTSDTMIKSGPTNSSNSDSLTETGRTESSKPDTMAGSAQDESS